MKEEEEVLKTNKFFEEGLKWRQMYIGGYYLPCNISSRRQDYREFFNGAFCPGLPVLYFCNRELAEMVRETLLSILHIKSNINNFHNCECNYSLWCDLKDVQREIWDYYKDYQI